MKDKLWVENFAKGMELRTKDLVELLKRKWVGKLAFAV